MALRSTQPLTEMSTRIISWGKGCRCVRLTILPPSCAVVTKSGNLNFLEPSGPVQACNGPALCLRFTGQYSVCGSGDPSAVICGLDTGGERKFFFVSLQIYPPQEIPVGSNWLRDSRSGRSEEEKNPFQLVIFPQNTFQLFVCLFRNTSLEKFILDNRAESLRRDTCSEPTL